MSHSGAPIDITPTKDDPVLGNDPSRNNNFSFADSGQSRCPYAAHVRKANPRDDLKNLGGTLIHRIWRQGIPFGPEVTREERQQSKTLHSRGLLFVCYQSNIKEGFSFVQQCEFFVRCIVSAKSRGTYVKSSVEQHCHVPTQGIFPVSH
jgi:deferrochelatase/peroxidase EfeB